MITERIWEGFDITAIENITVIGDDSLERFYLSAWNNGEYTDYNLPYAYELSKLGDFSKLWIERFDIKICVYFKDKTNFIWNIKKGFVYNKANSPGKDNILEGENAAKLHDINGSCKYLDFLPINNDKGWRSANLLMFSMMKWFLKENLKAELAIEKKRWERFKIRLKFWGKRRRAKVWYKAVSTIAGQAFYENCDRPWHKETTSFEVLDG